jgi:citrate synthase
MKNNSLIINLADDKRVSLPLRTGVCGADVAEIAPLASEGIFTYDPGFAATAACSSRLTFIDGEQGILRYCGYPIEEMSANSDYLETCYLLLFGELPNKSQKQDFTAKVYQQRSLDANFSQHIAAFAQDTHPMAMLCSLTSVLAGQYHQGLDITDPQQRLDTAVNLIAKLPLIAAECYRHLTNKDPINLRDDLAYAENFLYLLGDEGAEVNPVFAKALDLLFLLHADHEQNASTSTVRLSGSSGANPYACISAGMATLWGPAHGGANEAVLNMLNHIVESGRDVSEFVNKAKDKNDPFRLMGFGHRVYKNFDPRARIVRDMCYKVLDHAGENKIFQAAQQLEKYALEDEYFIEKKLYPNVDFYSGIIMHALGIPSNMFTVMFALGRSIGWISHWHEMLSAPYRIGRPRQLYIGHDARHYPTK